MIRTCDPLIRSQFLPIISNPLTSSVFSKCPINIALYEVVSLLDFSQVLVKYQFKV
jgi:hypothetical protein